MEETRQVYLRCVVNLNQIKLYNAAKWLGSSKEDGSRLKKKAQALMYNKIYVNLRASIGRSLASLLVSEWDVCM